MKISVSNTVVLNGGDAAILLSLIRTLKEALGQQDFETVVFDKDPEIAARYYPELQFKPSMWRSLGGRFARWKRWQAKRRLISGSSVPFVQDTLEVYQRSSCVVATGGTYLVEHYDLEPRLFDFEATLKARTPLVLFTQSMGPFRRDSHRQRLRRILEEAHLVLLRDGESLQHVRELGVRSSRIRVQADGTFVLADEETLRTARSRTFSPHPTAAVSVRAWEYFQHRSPDEGMRRYREAVARSVKSLVRLGFRVTFLSTCQGIPEYFHDDAQTARQIRGLLPPSIRRRTSVDADFHHPLQLRRLYGTFDLVLATRLHAGILALSAGTPVFPIAYEFKTKSLFQRLGIPEAVQDIETIDGEEMAKELEAFVLNLDSQRGPLLKAVERERASALESAGLIRDVLSED